MTGNSSYGSVIEMAVLGNGPTWAESTVIESARQPKYRCEMCRKWYRPLWSVLVSCCVLHAPGECCHAFEERVHKKGWHKRHQT